jgi:hypothetical protein
VGILIEEVVVAIWAIIILEVVIITEVEVALDNNEVLFQDREIIKLSNASFLNKVSIKFLINF